MGVPLSKRYAPGQVNPTLYCRIAFKANPPLQRHRKFDDEPKIPEGSPHFKAVFLRQKAGLCQHITQHVSLYIMTMGPQLSASKIDQL